MQPEGRYQRREATGNQKKGRRMKANRHTHDSQTKAFRSKVSGLAKGNMQAENNSKRATEQSATHVWTSSNSADQLRSLGPKDDYDKDQKTEVAMFSFLC